MHRLVKKAKRGNKRALVKLINEERDAFYRLAFSYMKNEQDAMDALENMIVQVYQHIDQLRQEELFYSWSKTILVNECKRELKKSSREILVESFDTPPFKHMHSKNEIDHVDQQMEVERLLSKISRPQADAIRLKYFHDLDLATIAEIENVPVGTVKSRISTGLKKLRSLEGGEKHG